MTAVTDARERILDAAQQLVMERGLHAAERRPLARPVHLESLADQFFATLEGASSPARPVNHSSDALNCVSCGGTSPCC